MTDYKKDFPLLSGTNTAYLDNAATTQRPQAVLDAIRSFYEEKNANPLRGVYGLAVAATDCYEEARTRVQQFIRAAGACEIIFTRNTTESINLAAYSYGLSHLGVGDEVLVFIDSHHSNLLPWQMVTRRTGAKLVYFDCEPDGSYDMEKLAAAITPATRLAALTQVSNVTGQLHPVKEITALVHAAGGVVLVDAAQSAPHIPIDVQALGADFLAFSGHKLYGPMGIGVLYGKADILNGMEPFLTGGEMIDSVSRFDAVYAPLPHKFEAGTVNAAGAAGLHAAIDYVESIGMDAIRQREDALTALAFTEMSKIPGIHIQGSADPADHHGILSFTLDDVHPHDIASILDTDQVCVRAGHHCAQPLLRHLGHFATSRASLAFYNTEEDIARFIESLSTIRRRMGYGV